MNYWLTVHYPHYVVDEAEWWIYVQRGKEKTLEAFRPGDRVAFYEVNRGPDRVAKGKRPRGGMGIKCLATASAFPRAATFQEKYVDGTSTEFALECPCNDQDFTHWLPMNDLFAALGYRLNLLGIGGRAICLSQMDFQKIEDVFLAADRG